MKRRHFLRTGAMLLGGAVIPYPPLASASGTGEARRFQLDYAPHFGMFKRLAGGDLIDQLKFAAELGFAAWEDDGLMNRPAALQDRIAATMDALGMRMGTFVATASYHEVTFARRNAAVWRRVQSEILAAAELAERMRARWMTVVPGHCDGARRDDCQTAACVELLKRCCEILEPRGVVMLLEPLPWRRERPGCFLRGVSQAYKVCRSVGSPACKILLDARHQDAAQADPGSAVDGAWSEIAYVRCGSKPPGGAATSGAADANRWLKRLVEKRYRGIVGLPSAGPAGVDGVFAPAGYLPPVIPRSS